MSVAHSAVTLAVCWNTLDVTDIYLLFSVLTASAWYTRGRRSYKILATAACRDKGRQNEHGNDSTMSSEHGFHRNSPCLGSVCSGSVQLPSYRAACRYCIRCHPGGSAAGCRRTSDRKPAMSGCSGAEGYSQFRIRSAGHRMWRPAGFGDERSSCGRTRNSRQNGVSRTYKPAALLRLEVLLPVHADIYFTKRKIRPYRAG